VFWFVSTAGKMTASLGHHHHHRVSAAAESMIHLRRAVVHPELVSSTALDVHSTVAGGGPWVEVVEQPKSTAMRFRYLCEGRSAGTILGVNATVAQKTYPTIRVSFIHMVAVSRERVLFILK